MKNESQCELFENEDLGSHTIFPRVLTPNSPRWPAFIEALSLAVKINGCDSRTRPLAIRLMQTMGNVDIDASLKFFDEHGGFCDCEILMNVDYI